MSFALKLKELREKKGLSQAQLAKELNVGIGSVGMWESTQRTPPAKKLKNIAEYFGVTIDYFFVEDDEKLVSDYYKRNSMNIPQIAHRLREVRLKSGFSQAELGKKLNISSSSIRDFELGFREPSTFTLWQYCECLGVSADYLIGVKNDFGARTLPNAATMGEGANAQERELLELFRTLSPYLQGLTLETVRSWTGANGNGLHKNA